MNITDIQGKLEQLNAALEAKGYTQAACQFHIDSGALSEFWIVVKCSAGGDSMSEYCCGETYDYVVNEADAFIRNLPSMEEKRLHNFMDGLGKLIDKGRDIGIDVEFLNPLTASMEKLSKNVLTYRSGAVK